MLNLTPFVAWYCVPNIKRLPSFENNGKVLPGYLETLGFLGTSKPSLVMKVNSPSISIVII